MKIKFGNEILDLEPSKIIAVARNYKAHAEEMGTALPSEPKFFLKPPSALLAHKGQVILPPTSSRVDYEVELAVIVGSRAKSVPPESVSAILLGYSVLVDVTARDLQATAKKQGMPWTVAKGFDTFAPMGPCIVPARSVDPSSLDIWLRVNGELKQNGNTNLMVFPVSALVSFISRIMTLEPMDVIATGTPSGVGPMEDGDVIEAGIEGIGTLTFSTVRER